MDTHADTQKLPGKPLVNTYSRGWEHIHEDEDVMKDDKQYGLPIPRSSWAIRRRRRPLDWPTEHEFRILSIDGGGIRGVFPAAFLAGLEERYLDGAPVSRYFDLIAGTSTGGVIAIGLGAGLRATELRDLYTERGCEIFPPTNPISKKVHKGLSLFRYRYNSEALRKILSDSFGHRTLAESKSRLCIPACDGQYGEVYVFKTPHHPDFFLDGKETMVKVAIATSAAPTFFQPLDDGGYTFLDGGLWANNPIMVGLVEALTSFSVPRERIRILSLGCGGSTYRIGRWKKRLGGILSWYDIIVGATRFQSLNALGQAGLLIGANRVIRVDAQLQAKPIHLDDWTRAKEELPIAASQALETHGEVVASLFLTDPAALYRSFLPTPSSPATADKQSNQHLSSRR